MVRIPRAVSTVIAEPGEQTFRVIGIALSDEINDPQRIVSVFAAVWVLRARGVPSVVSVNSSTCKCASGLSLTGPISVSCGSNSSWRSARRKAIKSAGRPSSSTVGLRRVGFLALPAWRQSPPANSAVIRPATSGRRTRVLLESDWSTSHVWMFLQLLKIAPEACRVAFCAWVA